MNTLCVLRTVFFKNRWYLLFCIMAFSLGYALGLHYANVNRIGLQDDKKLVITEWQTVDNVQMSIDFWRKIQLKIDKIAGNIEELTYMSRDTCRFDAGDMPANAVQ